jgi:hypothetical protein
VGKVKKQSALEKALNSGGVACGGILSKVSRVYIWLKLVRLDFGELGEQFVLLDSHVQEGYETNGETPAKHERTFPDSTIVKFLRPGRSG